MRTPGAQRWGGGTCGGRRGAQGKGAGRDYTGPPGTRHVPPPLSAPSPGAWERAKIGPWGRARRRWPAWDLPRAALQQACCAPRTSLLRWSPTPRGDRPAAGGRAAPRLRGSVLSLQPAARAAAGGACRHLPAACGQRWQEEQLRAAAAVERHHEERLCVATERVIVSPEGRYNAGQG
jgi:hypothetical protein